jgi:hypothetical protein
LPSDDTAERYGQNGPAAVVLDPRIPGVDEEVVMGVALDYARAGSIYTRLPLMRARQRRLAAEAPVQWTFPRFERSDLHTAKGEAHAANDILVTENSLIVLSDVGEVIVYSRATDRRICCLNRADVAQAIFYNPNGTLIVVHSGSGDGGSGRLYVSVWCAASLDKGDPREKLIGSFSQTSVHFPGFIEFDDVNSRIVVSVPETQLYKIWDMATYQLIFECNQFQEMRVAKGIGVFFSSPKDHSLHLVYKDMVDGAYLGSNDWMLKENARLIFIEQFHEFTLVKEEHELVKVLDGKRKTVLTLPQTEKFNPLCFQYTEDQEHFFTISNPDATSNSPGQLDIWDVPHFTRKTILGITSLNQPLLACVPRKVVFGCYKENVSDRERAGTTKRLRCEQPLGRTVVAAFRFSDGVQVGRVALTDPSEEIAAMAYDENLHELFIGLQNGVIARWR